MYTTILPVFERGIIAELDATFDPRIGQVSYSTQKCRTNELIVELDLIYKIKEKKDIFANIVIAKNQILADEIQAEYKVSFDDMVFKDGKYRFKLTLPYGVGTDEEHHIYLRLMNDEGYGLSKETKTFTKANIITKK